MDRVGIREARQHLSRYASRVRAGESFVITDRGEEVAHLVPPPGRQSALDRLVTDRGARAATADLRETLDTMTTPIGGPPSEAVLDELRGERF